MDQTDLKLIALLQEDGRMSITELAKHINLSRPSASERLQKLRENGTIQGFKVVIDPQKIGYPITFYMMISEVVGSVDSIVRLLKNSEYVTEIHSMTGKMNYLVKASAPTIDAMHAFLSNLIKYCKVESSIVLDSPLKDRSLSAPITFKTSQ